MKRYPTPSVIKIKNYFHISDLDSYILYRVHKIFITNYFSIFQMRAILSICLFSLIHNGQSYRIVPKHIESGPIHSLQVFFSTQINQETRTVLSTVTQTDFHTCYTTEPEIAECQKKRELDAESTNNNENEDLIILSDPKVEVNGVAANWENIISPSRVNVNVLMVNSTICFAKIDRACTSIV